ncbi:MAG: methyltransferase domain-containing protein [Hyphomicrobiaceae bacterium]|nr:methyltransferase domain-containing protein [Hyphomicrobiaceae bacterium]
MARGTKNWPIFAKEWARSTLRDPMQHFKNRRQRKCPCCGHEGLFVSAKRRVGPEMRCPNCASRPRDRFLSLVLRETGGDLSGKRIMHFAPEWPLFRQLKGEAGYVGGDIIKRRNANAVVDITRIDFPADSFDYLICNHVLEHVPDHLLAMRECARVLRPDGIAFFSVPLDKRRSETWYPPEGMTVAEVEKVCGWDHKRLYGRDFRELLASAGMIVTAIEPRPEWVEPHRLYDEQFFVATKQPGRFKWAGPKWAEIEAA